jgi:hypothetical protein
MSDRLMFLAAAQTLFRLDGGGMNTIGEFPLQPWNDDIASFICLNTNSWSMPKLHMLKQEIISMMLL